jgi:CheY-like chemotaxis protein
MNKKLVLIVDDEATIREMLEMAFKAWGYETVSRNNGQDALAYILSAEPQPDLIITDNDMPFMGGIEFLELARSNKYLGEVIFSSGRHAALDDISLGRLAKVAAHSLPKPFELKDLKPLVDEIFHLAAAA